jgi:hypothetical protein
MNAPVNGVRAVTVGLGQTVSTSFGLGPQVAGVGNVAGTLWADMNSSNSWDSGDIRLAGWRVYHDANSNNRYDVGEQNAFSDSNGNYTITDVPSNAYRAIRQVMQPGWQPLFPSNNQVSVNVITGQTASASFGNGMLPGGARITGNLFHDVNANYSWDSGDQRCVGWQVYLDANNNSVLDTNEVLTTTDQNGAYNFPGLAAGTYVVRQVMQAGWRQTAPRAGDAYTLTLVAGQVAQATFGNTRAMSTINGSAFHDANGNSFRDAGEQPLANWAVYVDDNNNGENDLGERWITTDANGNFAFTGLPAGSYRIRLINHYGWTPTLGSASAVAVVNGSNSVNALGFAARQNPEPASYDDEKLVSWFLIGGSSANTADRGVGWNIKTQGWAGFVQTHVQPQLAWGVKRIMLHNPFGIMPGEDYQADQAIEAQSQGLNWLTNSFAEAWAPITAQGIEVIAYMGAPMNDASFTGLSSTAWWSRFWASMDLPMQAGMNIALDKSLAANPGTIDWDAVVAMRSQGHLVYGEPRPPESAMHWRTSPLIAEDWMWDQSNPELHPEEMNWAAKDSQITGEVLRMITRPPDGQTWGNTSTWLRSYAREIMREGHTVVANIQPLINSGISLSSVLLT